MPIHTSVALPPPTSPPPLPHRPRPLGRAQPPRRHPLPLRRHPRPKPHHRRGTRPGNLPRSTLPPNPTSAPRPPNAPGLSASSSTNSPTTSAPANPNSPDPASPDPPRRRRLRRQKRPLAKIPQSLARKTPPPSSKKRNSGKSSIPAWPTSPNPWPTPSPSASSKTPPPRKSVRCSTSPRLTFGCFSTAPARALDCASKPSGSPTPRSPHRDPLLPRKSPSSSPKASSDPSPSPNAPGLRVHLALCSACRLYRRKSSASPASLRAPA